MPNEEKMRATADAEEKTRATADAEGKEASGEKPAATGSEMPSETPSLEEEIDLNKVFPEEETDLNELFPEAEMKHLLKKVQKNKKDLNSMRERFSDGI